MTASVNKEQFHAIEIGPKAAILADVSVRYLSCGDTAFTVEFGNEISPEINGKVMALHAEIGRAKAARLVRAAFLLNAVGVAGHAHPAQHEPAAFAAFGAVS